MFYVRGIDSSSRALTPGYFRSRRHVTPVGAPRPISSISTDEQGLETTTQASTVIQRYQDSAVDSQPEDILYVRQIMSSPVFSLTIDATVGQAAKVFAEKRYRHIPIVNSGGEVVGLVSDRDILRSQVEHQGVGMSSKIVDIMVKEVLIATPDTLIRDVGRTMFEERVGSLPVVERDGALVGMITRSDLIRAMIVHGPMRILA